MRFDRRKVRRLLGLAIGVLTLSALLAARLADPPTLTALRGAGFDTLQRVFPRFAARDQPVRIVDIDEASLAKLGQWPWPRNSLAELVNRLKALGAAAIVFDIMFPEADRLSPAAIVNKPDLMKGLGLSADSGLLTALPDNDKLFGAAIADSPVVLATAAVPNAPILRPYDKAGFAATGQSAILAPPPLRGQVNNLDNLTVAAKGLGLITLDLAQSQGITRDIPLLWSDGTGFRPSLVLEALRVAQGASTYVVNGSPTSVNAIQSVSVGALEIPTAEDGQFSVYYTPDDKSLYVSAADVLNDAAQAAISVKISGNIVLIGTSAAGLLDTRTSSLGEAVPGVSVHAQVLQQILSGQFLVRPQWATGAEMSVTFVLATLLVGAAAYARPGRSVAGCAAAIAALLGLVVFAFKAKGVVLDVSFPLLALLTAFLATITFRLLVIDREGRQMRLAFGHYVAPSVLRVIEADPGQLKLGGQVREITVMFVDIENFTPLSEKLQPDELVRVINDVLSCCSTAILANFGTIDKFMGDAVMAFWNAPLDQPDHQYLAARAALDVQTELSKLNAQGDFKSRLAAIGAWPVGARIGLASGPACVGNMGASDRFDYSVVGETVNIAARAETACKTLGVKIVIAGKLSEKTASLNPRPETAIAMKGKSQAMTVWSLGN